MATARIPSPPPAHLLVGQTVHYRDRHHCWAAAVVESGPKESAQLYLFPLPPNFPMPQAPGTFVPHDRDRQDESWHRLIECSDDEPEADAEIAAKSARRRGRSRRRAPAR